MASTQPGSSPSSAALSKAKAYSSESVELSIQPTTKNKIHIEPCSRKESPKSQNKYEVPVHAKLMQNTHEVKKATVSLTLLYLHCRPGLVLLESQLRSVRTAKG
jgi:hypothetical protein